MRQARTTELKLEYHPLAGLIPYARNARTHSEAQVAQIAASIREYGWTNPVLVDGAGGIIAGHGRVLAARKLGMDAVAGVKPHLLDLAQDVWPVCAPPPDLSLSQWAGRERRLSPESSPEPGKWDTSRAEYQRGIMDRDTGIPGMCICPQA